MKLAGSRRGTHHDIVGFCGNSLRPIADNTIVVARVAQTGQPLAPVRLTFTLPGPCEQIGRPWILRPQPKRRASRCQPGYLQPRTHREGLFRAYEGRDAETSRG